MTTASTNKNNNVFLKLHHLLNGEAKEYSISFAICIFFFLAFTITDIILSIHYNLYPDAIAMGTIGLFHLFFIAVKMQEKRNVYLPLLIYFITAVLLSALYMTNGFSTGIYFYFFPATIAYINSTYSVNTKTRFRYFYLVIFLFTAALAANFFLLPHQQSGVGQTLLVFRLVASVTFTVLLVKHLLVLLAYKKNTQVKNSYYEALFQSYLDAYIVFNKESQEVIDYNQRVELMFELPAGTDLKGIYLSQVMMRYLDGESMNFDVMMNKIPDEWHGEALFISHNKHKFYGYVKSVVFYKGEEQYQILSIRDINEMKVADQELKVYKESVEKAANAKARFLASMSHELRTPLNGIIGTSNLVLTDPFLPSSIKDQINVLRYSSEHMLGIINEILDFSKIDAGKMELKQLPFNVKDCLNNITQSFATQFRDKKLELNIELDPQLDNVHLLSDEIKLSQVIANLLSNALKFTFAGKVTFRIAIEKIEENHVTLFFEIKDTGIGIAKEKQGDIFQGFTQVHTDELRRRYGGTGLGLTISEKLVDIFGGKLEVESELGQGARFYFTLCFETAQPILVYTKNLSIPEKANTGTDIRGIRVLVVEDNEINASILKGFLNKWQIRVKEATHGIHALELMKYHDFDLILMDLEMPEMDGYTTVKKIRETGSTIPIVAFTAALLENMNTLITEAGFNDYVLKPFRPSELKKKIELYAPHRKIEYA